MGCAGNTEIYTPNLDCLAREGTRLTNFFCASPVCSPARASLLTGRIPSQHGVHDWLRPIDLPTGPNPKGVLTEYLHGQKGYTEFLAADGYVCGISGKWHLGDEMHSQKGFAFLMRLGAGNITRPIFLMRTISIVPSIPFRGHRSILGKSCIRSKATNCLKPIQNNGGAT